MMYHLQPIRPTGFIRPKNMNRADVRTCSIDTYRIQKLAEESCAAAPPLEDGDTPGSDTERKELDQKSCSHPGYSVTTNGSKQQRWHDTRGKLRQ